MAIGAVRPVKVHAATAKSDFRQLRINADIDVRLGVDKERMVFTRPGRYHLNLYGKLKASKGRKMGHLTVTGPTVAAARATALAAAKILGIAPF